MAWIFGDNRPLAALKLFEGRRRLIQAKSPFSFVRSVAGVAPLGQDRLDLLPEINLVHLGKSQSGDGDERERQQRDNSCHSLDFQAVCPFVVRCGLFRIIRTLAPMSEPIAWKESLSDGSVSLTLIQRPCSQIDHGDILREN